MAESEGVRKVTRSLVFHILGPFAVLVSNGHEPPLPLVIGPAKERALLAMLLLRPNETVSADALIDALWGESPPASSRKLLQVYVSHLRKALAEDVIETKSVGYRLSIEPEAVDAGRFERLVAAGTRAGQLGDSALASALLRQGLALWSGPALVDFAFESFARIESERLEEMRLTALEELADADLALQRHGETAAELRAHLAAHPLRERMRGQLMLALYRSDRQAEALAVYEAGRRRLLDELGLEPGRSLQTLQHSILTHDPDLDRSSPAPSPSSGRAALPSAPTSLIGRARETRELVDLISAPDVRLITITGPGGIGKTRLAVAACTASIPRFDGGTIFVDLSSESDPALVMVTIADAVEKSQPLMRMPGRSLALCIAETLSSRPVLLVLDNCELVAAAAPEIGAVIANAPRLTVVATSRVRLRLTGEHVYAVPPLVVPTIRDIVDIDALAGIASVALFVERARSATQDFELTAENKDAVAHICTRLEGVPLAIELAAPRLAMLSPQALVDRLDPRLPLLADGAWDLPARQRTLRATIDWSHALLEPSQQWLLGWLAQFSGGWTLDAAEEVCGPGPVLADMTALLENSLVWRTGESPAPRYNMLETVREYAIEQLAIEDGDARRDRVAQYFFALSVRAEQELSGGDQADWFRRLQTEHENLRATLKWLQYREQPASELDMVSALGRYWYVRGHLDEGRRALTGALARGEGASAAARAKGFRIASAIAVIQGDYGSARNLAEAGLALYRSVEDHPGVVRSLSNLGAILLGEGDTAGAIVVLDESVALSRNISDRRLAALALNNRGDVALTMGAFAEAANLFAESLAILRAAGDHANVARSLFNLGAAMLEAGSAAEGSALLGESLALSVNLDDKEDVIWCLVGLSAVAERLGDPLDAVRVLAGAMALLDDISATMKPFERGLQERTLAALRSKVEPSAFAATWGSGRDLSFDDLIAVARQIQTTSH